MSDLAIATTWLGILGGGIAGAMILRSLGVASTYIRDLLHVGAGVWILGWPFWHGAAFPIAIVGAAAGGILVVPRLAKRLRVADHFRRSVTSGDEHWGGLILYTIAYAIFTTIGLTVDPFPAAAALLALSLGDGIGGAAGRALGEHHYRAPGGKRKSLEGSGVVAVAAMLGTLLAALLFDVALPLTTACVLGLVAAVTEALSPRGTDNLLIPATVYIAVQLLT